MKNLISEYKRNKEKIKGRLDEFRKLSEGKDKDIFRELSFCILTPQSKAINCDKAIKELVKSNMLFEGTGQDIKTKLRGLVRFHNKKSAYLVSARKAFMNRGKFNIKNRLDVNDILKTREWLVKNIKGVGYKEASHFLRNIGLGRDIAILDTHILKNLKEYKVIQKIPNSVTKTNYINIEDRMKRFAEKIKIPLEELDLLLWSKETGFVFK